MRKVRLFGLTLVAAFTLGAAPPAVAATTIETTAGWNGFLDICDFGSPNTATYGQVVRVPPADTALDEFTFYVRESTGPGTITYRGEVFAWDGAKATGPSLWESAARTLTLSSSFQALAFEPGRIPLIAGRQYVLFASISKDYEQNDDASRSCWAYRYQDVYNGGGFVFLNNFGDESEWTTAAWETSVGNGVDDLVFKASFSRPLPISKDQCNNDGWRAFGIFKNQGDCVSFVATGRRNQPSGP
jgi:hypothetical protein